MNGSSVMNLIEEETERAIKSRIDFNERKAKAGFKNYCFVHPPTFQSFYWLRVPSSRYQLETLLSGLNGE